VYCILFLFVHFEIAQSVKQTCYGLDGRDLIPGGSRDVSFQRLVPEPPPPPQASKSVNTDGNFFLG
jgi:hypothetical protein